MQKISNGTIATIALQICYVLLDLKVTAPSSSCVSTICTFIAVIG